ncbi:MAG: 50S ribosomal protein L25/general stress protein Ctc [Chlamydiales bacterium]|nr:50S ribosomal protein L25/general stress protein Ctc [Chlamydiales bacterium]
MKLTVTARAQKKKSDTKQVRREGNIPGIIYSPGKEPELIVINGIEYATLMRSVESGRLPTTIFTLVFGKKERRAILKEVQYEITNYQVSHLDFQELHEDVLVQVKVPISITGAADCPGVKLGGFLRQVIRTVQVECLPKHIPTEFVVDVKDLGIAQSKRLSDINLPKHVRPLAKMDEVLAVIAKR